MQVILPGNLVCCSRHLSSFTPPTQATELPSPGRRLRDRRGAPRPPAGTLLAIEPDLPWGAALRRHWPEYAIEAGFLALFLLAAGIVTAWFESPASPWHAALPDPLVRRLLTALTCGLVVATMIHSSWGRRSGSHLNPAITLAYLRLGKIGRPDALFYVLAQCAGAAVAVLLLRAALPALLPATMAPTALASPTGPGGEWAALAIEVVLSAAEMLMILFTSNHSSWMRWTGTLYGLLAVAMVAWVSPLAGFGLNPARLLALHMPGGLVTAHWLNVPAPFLGMLLGVEAWRLLPGRPAVYCVKLAHNTRGRCIFRCQHPYQARALALEAIQRRAPNSGKP